MQYLRRLSANLAYLEGTVDFFQLTRPLSLLARCRRPLSRGALAYHHLSAALIYWKLLFFESIG